MTTDKPLPGPTDYQLDPNPGCNRCRPRVAKMKNTPSWFFGSNNNVQTKLPLLGLQEEDLERKASVLVPEDERLSRVQEWLRRSHMGDYHSEGKKRTVKVQNIGNLDEAPKKVGRNASDARNWYINKATRTSATTLFGGDAENLRQMKTFPAKLNCKLEPLDQRSATSGSLNSGNQRKHNIDSLGKSSIIPEDDVIRQHFERKKKLERHRMDRSFTKSQFAIDDNSFREKAGPINRPHSPSMSLAARQRSNLGNENWLSKARPKPRFNEVQQMQNRTYELQTQLQQMLDRQKAE